MSEAREDRQTGRWVDRQRDGQRLLPVPQTRLLPGAREKSCQPRWVQFPTSRQLTQLCLVCFLVEILTTGYHIFFPVSANRTISSENIGGYSPCRAGGVCCRGHHSPLVPQFPQPSLVTVSCPFSSLSLTPVCPVSPQLSVQVTDKNVISPGEHRDSHFSGLIFSGDRRKVKPVSSDRSQEAPTLVLVPSL